MLAIAWIIVKALMLLVVMAVGGLLIAYALALSFVTGLERHPSNIARFRWLCLGGTLLGLLAFAWGAAGFAWLALA